MQNTQHRHAIHAQAWGPTHALIITLTLAPNSNSNANSSAISSAVAANALENSVFPAPNPSANSGT